jgi:predicted nucleic acid-binding protein
VTDFLLDTTFFIDLRRGRNEGALSLWQSLQSGSASGAYSPITVFELWVGQRFNREEEVFYESVLSFLEEAPLTSGAAKSAALWLRQIGSASEALIRDALIAATASERDEPVRTLNQRDFGRFPVTVHTY